MVIVMLVGMVMMGLVVVLVMSQQHNTVGSAGTEAVQRHLT